MEKFHSKIEKRFLDFNSDQLIKMIIGVVVRMALKYSKKEMSMVPYDCNRGSNKQVFNNHMLGRYALKSPLDC